MGEIADRPWTAQRAPYAAATLELFKTEINAAIGSFYPGHQDHSRFRKYWKKELRKAMAKNPRFGVNNEISPKLIALEHLLLTIKFQTLPSDILTILREDENFTAPDEDTDEKTAPAVPMPTAPPAVPVPNPHMTEGEKYLRDHGSFAERMAIGWSAQGQELPRTAAEARTLLENIRREIAQTALRNSSTKLAKSLKFCGYDDGRNDDGT